MKKIFLLCLLAIIFTGCKDNSENSLSIKDINNYTWQLSVMDDKPPIEGTVITLNFDIYDKVSGNGGCNSYTATYAPNAKYKIVGIGTSRDLCERDIILQESEYLKILAKAKSVSVKNDKLVISSFYNSKSLTFVPTNK